MEQQQTGSLSLPKQKQTLKQVNIKYSKYKSFLLKCPT